MNNLNLDILISTSKEKIVSDINQIFSYLLNEIENYIGLEAINSNVTIIIIENLNEDLNNFYDTGVRRKLTGNLCQIEIFENYLKFIHLILLREAYLCFIPYELREKQSIQIVLHEIIENDLSKLLVMDEWKTHIRSKIINYDYLSAQYDKLNKFFKLEATERTQSPTQFFFEFIRRNISLIQDKMDDFYYTLFEEFIYKTSKSLYNDEIVETIRVLVDIFYRVKIFRRYNEFEDYFQEFKDNGVISTFLSKRKFSENLRWISNSTIISPSFQLTHHNINVAVVYSIIKFNPILYRKDIYNVLDRIPFLHNPVFSRNGFSEEIQCTFLIPKIYLKDLLNLFENLYNFGYIINKECFIWKEHNNTLNLNYFREYFNDLRKIINPNHKEYNNLYELKFSRLYDEPHKAIEMNLLDWLVFERSRQVGITGFGFERREETLHSLKDELLNYIESEKGLISDLRTSLSIFYESLRLRNELLDFIEANKRFGFFYIEEMLRRILNSLDLIERIIKQNPEIVNLNKFQIFFKSYQFSRLIEENLIFKSKEFQSIVFRDIIPLYFKSNKEYNALKEKYYHFHNLFRSFRKLKIFSIDSMRKIIKNEKFPQRIYSTRENKLKQSFEKFKPYKITNQLLDSIFKKFLEKGLISPELINTIIVSSFAKYHPILLLKDTKRVKNQIKKLIKFFPRIFLERMRNLFNNESIIMIFMYFLNIKEKDLFSSILYYLFKDELISFKRYFTSGLVPFAVIKEFYDFNRKEFFYTKDLFEQSFLYIQKVFGDLVYPTQEIKPSSQDKFWIKEINIFNLVKEVDKRVSYEQRDFNISMIKKLNEFYRNLNIILINPERFKMAQQEQFFKFYIKSIKFIPAFQFFGLNQYFLYIHPSSIDQIDFKHLLINTFQSIKFSTVINDTNSLLIKYIFPYGKPNMKHLNWYAKTKHIIREYCLCSVKKIYQILNFNFNLSSNGWNYDSNRFKIYMQNILFNPNYKIEFFKIREFNLKKSSEQEFLGPNSIYFQSLTELFNRTSIDLKSFLGTRNYSFINNITTLQKKNLIFPYLSLKNLDFQDNIYIIIPNVKEELNSKIIKIFNFFNYGFIYEIEGEYYIYGFTEQIRFENGLIVKLYLPQCEVDEFLRLFDRLFEYLEINNYIVLIDLINGNNLLRDIYGDLSFLESYNPLINLKWNNKDKIWMNHKLFTEKFERIYPDLFFGKDLI
ncbi:MAG: hypothetical protein ACFFCE_17985 [Promethearchaeota archaeon]